MAHHHGGLGTIISLKQTLPEASLSIGTPVRFFSIIGLQHVRPLHVHGDDEIWSRIGIRLPGLSQLDVARHLDLIQAQHTILKVEVARSLHQISPLRSHVLCLMSQVNALHKFENNRAFK